MKYPSFHSYFIDSSLNFPREATESRGFRPCSGGGREGPKNLQGYFKMRLFWGIFKLGREFSRQVAPLLGTPN